jgi:hypothetical protein
MNEGFPCFPEIHEMLVGRYGFAIKLVPDKRPFARCQWFVLRPNCQHISGPFGTRNKAQQCLDKPNYEGEPRYGHEAAVEWLKGPKEATK